MKFCAAKAITIGFFLTLLTYVFIPVSIAKPELNSKVDSYPECTICWQRFKYLHRVLPAYGFWLSGLQLENVDKVPAVYFYKSYKSSKKNDLKILAIGDSWFDYPSITLNILPGPPPNILASLDVISKENQSTQQNVRSLNKRIKKGLEDDYNPLIHSRPIIPDLHIFSLANSRETARNIAGLEKKHTAKAAYKEGQECKEPAKITPAYGELDLSLNKRLIKYTSENFFDYILLSMGGNDILGSDDMTGILKKSPEGLPYQAYLNTKAFKDKLDELEKAYDLVISQVIENSKNRKIHIFAHDYEFLIPQNNEAALLGGTFRIGDGGRNKPKDRGWLACPLEAHGLKDKTEQTQLVKYMLTEFKNRLVSLDKKYPQFTLIDTQGSLDYDPEELIGNVQKDNYGIPFEQHTEQTWKLDFYWQNEIHLTPIGYRVAALKFYDAIMNDWYKKTLFI